MNQQLSLRRCFVGWDLEEERRNKAEEKVHEAAEAAQKAAEAARTRDPFDLSTASSTVGAASAPSAGFGGNRAEKYLPSLPLIDHLGMGKGAHEGGGDLALLYGDSVFLACASGRSVCPGTAAMHPGEERDQAGGLERRDRCQEL